MKISIDEARKMAENILKAADAAEALGETHVSIGSVSEAAALDDAAREELEHAIADAQ